MGGRGGGSPNRRQAATIQPSPEINFDIVERREDGGLTIIGSAPESIFGETGLWLTPSNRGTGFDVRDIVTDEILAHGRSRPDALRKLAKVTGLIVNYIDETAGDRLLGRYGG